MGRNDFAVLPNQPGRVAFGDFRFDPARIEVTLQGKPVALRPKAYALLAHFLAHPGRTLSKQELMTALWPKAVVTEDSLVQCVSELRAALGADGAQWISTVPRHGYRFDGKPEPVPLLPPPSPGPALPEPETRRRQARPAVWGAALVAALALVVGWGLRPMPVPATDLALTQQRSIAVLPIASPGGGQASSEWAEAMTEELIGDIARLPGTMVIARASAAAAAAQGPDARRIGQLLNVAHVVTGTLTQDDQGTVLALQLVSATTGTVLWSHRWQQPQTAISVWRGDVPLQVARALDLQLTASVHRATERAASRPAVASVARGDHLLRRTTAPADVLRARAAYQEAIAADAGSARAWAGLALSYLSEIQSRWSDDPVRQTALAAQAIQTALQIDPDLAQGHYAQGHLQMVRGDPAGALSSYQRVLSLNPSDAWAHVRVASALLMLGRFDEVSAAVERARRLSPLEDTQTSFGRVIAASAAFHQGRDADAYAQLLEATRGNPNNATAWALLASIDALHDRTAPAADALARLRTLRPQMTVSTFRTANAGNGAALRAGDERFHAGLLKAGLSP